MKRRDPRTLKQELLLQDEPAATKVAMQEALCWAGWVQELILPVSACERAPASHSLHTAETSKCNSLTTSNAFDFSFCSSQHLLNWKSK